MIIRCPQCEHARAVPENRIPATAEFATCPKCGQRFRFRTVKPCLEDNNARAEEKPAVGAGVTARSAREVLSPQTAVRETTRQDDVWDAVDALNQHWQSRVDRSVAEPGAAVSESRARKATAPGAERPGKPEKRENLKPEQADAASASILETEKTGRQTGEKETQGRNRIPTPDAGDGSGAVPKRQDSSTESPWVSLNQKLVPQGDEGAAEALPGAKLHDSRPYAVALDAQPDDRALLGAEKNGKSAPAEEFTLRDDAEGQGNMPSAGTNFDSDNPTVFPYAEDGPPPEERVERDLEMLRAATHDRPLRDLGTLREFPDSKPHSASEDASLSLREENFIPWENPAGQGWFRGGMETVRGVMLRGPAFFSNFPVGGSLTPGFLFFLIMGYLTLFGSFFWTQLMALLIPDLFPPVPRLTNMPVLLLAAPLFLGLMLLFITGTIRIVARLASAEQVPFALAYRVASYSSAPFVLSVVPLIGTVLGACWFTAALLTGCRNALKFSWLAAILATLPPAAVLFGGFAWCFF